MEREATGQNHFAGLIAILGGFGIALALSGLVHDAQSDSIGKTDREIARVTVRCTALGSGEAEAKALIDPGGEELVRLLLEKRSVRPGESFSVAPLNLTSSTIKYGLSTYVVEAGTGEKLPGPGSGIVFAIGLSASPGRPGSCASVSIPNSAPPGEYLAVLDDVTGGDLAKTDVSAPFTIEGEPRHPEEYVEAGVTPAKSPVKVLYEPRGEPRNAEPMNPWKVRQTISAATGKEAAGMAFEPDFEPDGARVVLLDGEKDDVPVALGALRREGLDVNRVAIHSSPYTAEEVKRAADRAANVMEKEPATSWGVSYDETRGVIVVEASELSASAFDEINRVASVPVGFRIASGSAGG